MKQFWLGLGLLVGILALAIWATVFMDSVHEPISAQLTQAAQSAVADDWERGRNLVRQAHTAWETHRKLTASVSSHNPMEQIDSLFAQLEIYGELEETALFSSVCAQLSRLMDAMGDAHDLNWWNLF